MKNKGFGHLKTRLYTITRWWFQNFCNFHPYMGCCPGKLTKLMFFVPNSPLSEHGVRIIRRRLFRPAAVGGSQPLIFAAVVLSAGYVQRWVDRSLFFWCPIIYAVMLPRDLRSIHTKKIHVCLYACWKVKVEVGKLPQKTHPGEPSKKGTPTSPFRFQRNSTQEKKSQDYRLLVYCGFFPQGFPHIIQPYPSFILCIFGSLRISIVRYSPGNNHISPPSLHV